jgi:predicted NBD/HSP70 family sugar kinase
MKIQKKHSNLHKILDIIIRKGEISRIDLAEITGLTRAAVGHLVDELMSQNLIMEAGIGEARGGRPPTLLQPVPQGCYFIGAAVFDFSWSLVMMDLSGAIIDECTYPISRMTPEETVSQLIKAIKQLKDKHREKRILPRIGVGTPGLVDSEKGIIVSAFDVRWMNFPIADMIKKESGMSIRVVNRSKVSALASYYLHNPENYGNIISIVIGTGVASGLILDHKLYMGSSFGAGELGHTSVIPNGPACLCGNRGCLQALIGENAILERGQNLARINSVSAPEKIEDILNQSRDGELYHQVITEVAEYLSIAIGNIINLLNPDLIVLSGPVVSGCPQLLELVSQKKNYRSMLPNQDAVKVISSDWGIQTAAVGSAYLVRENTREILSQP